MEMAILVLCFFAVLSGGVASRCEDKHGDCGGWAARGDCELNPGFMLRGCPLSCGRCGQLNQEPPRPPALQIQSCADTNENCAAWAAHGECEVNPRYMLTSCAASCQVCQEEESECQDENEHCAEWASHEQCQVNPGYMLNKCQKACRVCSESTKQEEGSRKKEDKAKETEEESRKTKEESRKTEEESVKTKEESKKTKEEPKKTEEESESSEEESVENVAPGGSSISSLIGNLLTKDSKTVLRG